MSIPDSFDEFGLYKDTGFIFELPASLPEEYAPWHELAGQIAQLLETKEGVKKLKEEIKKLPKLNSKAITSYGELRLAHLQLGLLAGGFVHGDNGCPEKSIPECVAVPLHDVATRLGMLPALGYHSNMSNWFRLDPNGNMGIRYNLLGGKDFENFQFVQLAMEFSFSTLIPTIRHILEGSISKDEAKVSKALHEIDEWLQSFLKALRNYHTYINPKIFYKDILLLLRGFNPDVGLPNGVIYEGVDDKPIVLPTTAASETFMLQTVECLLRLDLAPEKRDFFKSFRDNRWIFAARRFYKFLEDWPGDVREMAMTSKSDELREIYNKIMESMKQFRSYHIQLITKFFIVPHREENGRPEPTDSVAELIPFLKDIRKSVISHKI